MVDGYVVLVAVRTLVECDDSGWHYRGVRLSLLTECPSIDRAAVLFETALGTVTGLLAVAASAEAGQVKVHLIYEDAEEGAEGEVVAYGSGQITELKLRKVTWGHLSPLFVFMATADDSTGQRFNAVFRWFSRGIEQVDPVDRFTAFWVALETLNVLLERKWDIVAEDRTCPHCNGSLGKRHGLLGIERLLSSIPEAGEEIERRVRKLRNGILHGFANLNQGAAEAQELSEVLAVAVLRGVAKVCDWDQAQEDSFARPPLASPPPFQLQARFKYIRDVGDLGLPGHHPIIEVRCKETVQHDGRGEPEGVSYEAHVSLTASKAMVLQPGTLACWVASREFGPIHVSRAIIRHNFEADLAYGHQPKGITLWELGTDDVWYPHPLSLGEKGDRV